MSSYTYEAKDAKTSLETYEWDNVWFEHTEDITTLRVMYIGDSISCATRRVATEVSERKILFDGFGTSKGLDNPYFKDSLRIFAKQQRSRNAIIINNGLHGWHLNDTTEYAAEYEKMILFLIKEFEDTPLYVVLTTHISDKARDERVKVRNEVVKKLAEKYSLEVIDLYSPVLEHPELISGDGVHLISDGYKILAKTIVEKLSSNIL